MSISKQGYKKNSPYKNRKSLTIDSNLITTEDMAFPVLGVSDTGDTKLMFPNTGEHLFNGSKVKEYKMKYQQGGNKTVTQFDHINKGTTDKGFTIEESGRASLRLNDKGREVTMLQDFLLSKGFYKGKVDGIFGPKTEQAVKEYQTWFNKNSEYPVNYKQDGKPVLVGADKGKLKVDGIVGDATRSALMYRKMPKENRKKNSDSTPLPEIPVGESTLNWNVTDNRVMGDPVIMDYLGAGILTLAGLAPGIAAESLTALGATAGDLGLASRVTNSMPEVVNVGKNVGQKVIQSVKNYGNLSKGPANNIPRSFGPKTPSSFGTRISFQEGGFLSLPEYLESLSPQDQESFVDQFESAQDKQDFIMKCGGMYGDGGIYINSANKGKLANFASNMPYNTIMQEGGMPQVANVPESIQNAEIEGGETVLDPSGVLLSAKGKKHSQGGIPVNLDPGTKVFSEYLEVPKEVLKAINYKGKRGVSFADVSKKYKTDSFFKMLEDPNADKFEVNHATLKLNNNMAMLETLFQSQEMVKEQSNKGKLKLGKTYQMGGLITPMSSSTTFVAPRPLATNTVPEDVQNALVLQQMAKDSLLQKEIEKTEALHAYEMSHPYIPQDKDYSGPSKSGSKERFREKKRGGYMQEGGVVPVSPVPFPGIKQPYFPKPVFPGPSIKESYVKATGVTQLPEGVLQEPFQEDALSYRSPTQTKNNLRINGVPGQFDLPVGQKELTGNGEIPWWLWEQQQEVNPLPPANPSNAQPAPVQSVPSIKKPKSSLRKASEQKVVANNGLPKPVLAPTFNEAVVYPDTSELGVETPFQLDDYLPAIDRNENNGNPELPQLTVTSQSSAKEWFQKNKDKFGINSKLAGTIFDIGMVASDHLDISEPPLYDHQKNPLFNRFYEFDNKEPQRQASVQIQAIQNSSMPEAVKQAQIAEIVAQSQTNQAQTDFANAQRYEQKRSADLNKLQVYQDNNLDVRISDFDNYRQRKAKVEFLKNKFKAAKKEQIVNSVKNYGEYVDELSVANELSPYFTVNPITGKTKIKPTSKSDLKTNMLSEFAQNANNTKQLPNGATATQIGNFMVVVDKEGKTTTHQIK
jgi:peptidoglycan hydrolase-like protein with peptidoglycan-binding domain